ncbi:hypothetical protein AAFF_G00263630 [Aldrovandia affinis]|uniref:Uncharacterized protein n=1 Tax=Aldrovandia affinis TaxID=143900 RepID=A0AAD7WT78_9TELE|nr:hypothetical protein AAFF_G00263630 [Aldrovandia affinis]
MFGCHSPGWFDHALLYSPDLSLCRGLLFKRVIERINSAYTQQRFCLYLISAGDSGRREHWECICSDDETQILWLSSPVPPPAAPSKPSCSRLSMLADPPREEGNKSEIWLCVLWFCPGVRCTSPPHLLQGCFLFTPHVLQPHWPADNAASALLPTDPGSTRNRCLPLVSLCPLPFPTFLSNSFVFVSAALTPSSRVFAA